MNGKFIVVEGIDGSGKTNVVKQIKNILIHYGIKKVICVREPGSTSIGEKLRKLIKYGTKKDNIISTTELLMIYAARVQLLETIIKPKLSKGIWIIGNRYELSSQAYQGGGRGINDYILKTMYDIFLKNCNPDITFYLDISPELALKRKNNIHDRIENESLTFFNRIRARYNKLARENTSIISIDASKTLTEVNYTVKVLLEHWIKNNKDVI